MRSEATLELERFLPYRLSLLSNRVSASISRAYASRFTLSITEWRVMAVLARFPGLSSNEVAERTAMDKVAISRAVGNLLDHGRLQRETHGSDRRKSVLTLSPAGHAIHADVVPRAKAYEQALLACLEDEERVALDRIIDKLMRQQAAAAEHL